MSYAITFDLNTETLKDLYPSSSFQNAYTEINSFLSNKGFKRQQGSVYFGNDDIDAVSTVTAVIELAKEKPWFAPSISDIQMLRIEEHSDLSKALDILK